MAGFSKGGAQDPSAASAYAPPQQWHGHQMQGQNPHWSDQWRQHMNDWRQHFPPQPPIGGPPINSGPMPPPIPQQPPTNAGPMLMPVPQAPPQVAPPPPAVPQQGPSNASLAQALMPVQSPNVDFFQNPQPPAQPRSPQPNYGSGPTLTPV